MMHNKILVTMVMHSKILATKIVRRLRTVVRISVTKQMVRANECRNQ